MAEMNKSLAMDHDDLYPMPMDAGKSEKKVCYPCFHYEGPEELDIPEDGVMTIRYCQKREVSEKKDGEHWYECDVEVKEIISVGGKKISAPARSGSETADALDRLAAALNSEEDEENE